MSCLPAPDPPAEVKANPDPPTRKQLIKRYLVTGLIAVLPLLVTVYILAWGFGFIGNTLGAWIESTMLGILGEGPSFQSQWANLLQQFLTSKAFANIAALIVFVAVIFGIGIALGTFVGEQVFRAFEERMSHLPMVRVIYPLVRQMTDLFGDKSKRQFGQVVAIDYPRKGIYSLGFITSQGVDEIRAADGRKMICVFVPNSPSPITGYVIFCPEDEVMPLKMTVDEAFKIIVSGGVVVPQQKVIVTGTHVPVAGPSAAHLSIPDRPQDQQG